MPADICGCRRFWPTNRCQWAISEAITVEPFTAADAIDAGRLRPLTRDVGLSLGDRACLALARRLDAPALTADTDWQGVAHGVELRPIR
jgi:ribonuclease VapC